MLIRRAVAADLPRIVELLADDMLGAGREHPGDLAPYAAAFELIDLDPNELLVVAEQDGEVVATAQLTLIHGLSRGGASRAQIEGVRVAAEARGAQVGRQLMEWAIGQARDWGCAVVQLTSDKARTDAHRFYERLGFVRSHEGFKLPLV